MSAASRGDEGGGSGLPAGGPAPAAWSVSLQNVSKRFGSKVAVDRVSLHIPVGSAFGMVGPNGAGKTTIFSMMAGYLRPTAGSVEVLGYSPSAVDALRSRIGVLPQDALLPASDCVGELLVHLARLQGIPAALATDVARRALADVEGGEWWTKRCGKLSHGMAKRVSLAQAFLGDPQVVLLDEPTAGLDPRAAWEMRHLVKAKRGSATIVLSSHNLVEVEDICDGAAILDGGRLVASGTMAELTAANGEVHIKVARGTKGGHERGEAPLQTIRELPNVHAARFDEETLDIVVQFDRKIADAETVISAVLWVLLQNGVRISGVSKGRGLERRVMDLTT